MTLRAAARVRSDVCLPGSSPGANAKLRYQITAGDVLGAFDVEPEVGTVFIAQPLDYEVERRYELWLVASDGKWENRTTVVVSVVNRNDEAPLFGQSQYHAAVTEELSGGPVLVLEVRGRRGRGWDGGRDG